MMSRRPSQRPQNHKIEERGVVVFYMCDYHVEYLVVVNWGDCREWLGAKSEDHLGMSHEGT